MSIARTIERACESQHCEYDIWSHDHTPHSLASAKRAHVPPARVAKGVALRDEQGPVLAVIPADRRLDSNRLNLMLHRHLYLMNEEELEALFYDCEVGAVPAAGPAYNLQTVTDTRLLGGNDIWFEGGDHESLIHMTGESFRRLMQSTRSGTISYLA